MCSWRIRPLNTTVYDADGLDLTADADWIARQLQHVQLAMFDSLRTLATGAKENESDGMAPPDVAAAW